MVIGAFPIAKLSVLLIKQISKPIANACKDRAKASPFFRTYVCMPPAQFYNWCEVKAKMWILNLGKPVNIPVLSQEMAIDLGANLLGETVIFVIGSVLLLVEYNRQMKKEAAKELKRLEEMAYITTTITDLYFSVQQHQTQLKEMERLVHGLSGNKPNPPTPTEPPKGPFPPAEGPPPPSPTLKNIHHAVQDAGIYSSNTPYPDRGIILRSLNYIQMDVLSSSVFSNSNNKQAQNVDTNEQKNTKPQRESAVLTEALHNIGNNFRSLF